MCQKCMEYFKGFQIHLPFKLDNFCNSRFKIGLLKVADLSFLFSCNACCFWSDFILVDCCWGEWSELLLLVLLFELLLLALFALVKPTLEVVWCELLFEVVEEEYEEFLVDVFVSFLCDCFVF